MRDLEILELLSQMTLDEKIGQMVQIKGDVFWDDKKNIKTGPLKGVDFNNEILYKIGSILNITDGEKARKIQEEYLSKNRLKIPLLFMGDIINGYETILPIPIAQGCSWNSKAIAKFAKLLCEESTKQGIHVNFSPMVDLVRDARWGRVMESAGGEDPFLGETYTKQIIEAYQGNNISKIENMAACVKHFAGYGAVEAGREYNSVDMSEREFRQYYLPAFKTAVNSGVEMIMPSFNIINGIPSTINKWLLYDVLRVELGFNGVIISDYGAIEETIYHGICKDKKEAAYKALKAGVDIDMMSDVYANNLKTLVLEGMVTEKQIDKSVTRILKLKNKIGLFENPYINMEKSKSYIINNKYEKIQELIGETFILLKNNNNILPLKKHAKIALIGPYADNVEIYGSWSIFVDRSRIKTLKQVFGSKCKNLLYAKGTQVLEQQELISILEVNEQKSVKSINEEKINKENIKHAIEIARQSEVIILAIGEHYLQSGEACSRNNICLPKNQQLLLDELYKLQIPIIGVLFSGRPLELRNVDNKLEALLQVWFPGTMGAEAIFDTIYGKINPSGKLTMSFPQTVGQCPIYYNHYSTGRPHLENIRYTSRYQDIPTHSYYEFGYGLSYSNFEYSDLKLSNRQMRKSETINVTIRVKNNSDIAGYETIQLYIQDIYASVVRPVKELKAFRKEFFKPREEKIITFTINEKMLKFWNEKLEYISEEGEFRIYIGKDSVQTLEGNFTLYN